MQKTVNGLESGLRDFEQKFIMSKQMKIQVHPPLSRKSNPGSDLHTWFLPILGKCSGQCDHIRRISSSQKLKMSEYLYIELYISSRSRQVFVARDSVSYPVNDKRPQIMIVATSTLLSFLTSMFSRKLPFIKKIRNFWYI